MNIHEFSPNPLGEISSRQEVYKVLYLHVVIQNDRQNRSF